MTYYTTEIDKTPQKPPNALKTAFSGVTIQELIFPHPSIENIYYMIKKIY